MSALESTAWSVNRPNDRDDICRLTPDISQPTAVKNNRWLGRVVLILRGSVGAFCRDISALAGGGRSAKLQRRIRLPGAVHAFL